MTLHLLKYFQCYRRILELDPENIQGLHNLCVVHVERGKLLEAQTCLEKAHQLAPGEDYVLKHLQIVQNRIAKLKLNPNEVEEDSSHRRSQVVSNKSIDEISDRKTQPVVSGDSEEQRYSSRVVNTEPMFVKNVDNIENQDLNVEFNDNQEQNVSNKWSYGDVGIDNDDPSSGMS